MPSYLYQTRWKNPLEHKGLNMIAQLASGAKDFDVLYESSSSSILCMCEQQSLLQDYTFT